MKILYLFIAIMAGGFIQAQQETVFRVSIPKHIQLSPSNTVLEPSKSYKFQVGGVPAERIVEFYFTGGTVDFHHSELTLKTLDTADAKKKYTLRAIIKVRDNLKEVTVKNFFISKVYNYVEGRDPDSARVIFYWGQRVLKVKDTATGRLPRDYYLEVHRKTTPDTRFAIISYEVTIADNELSQDYHINRNSRFPDDLVKKLNQLKPASVITFHEIVYSPANESADIRMAGPFSIFVKK